MQARIPGRNGRSASESAARTTRSSSSSAAARRARSAMSGARSASVFARRSSSSTRRFSLRAARSTWEYASGIKKVAACWPSRSSSLSASDWAMISMPESCAFALICANTGAISSLCSRKRFTSNSSTSLRGPSAQRSTERRMSLSCIISRSMRPYSAAHSSNVSITTHTFPRSASSASFSWEA